MGFMTNYLFKLARLRRDLHRLREERGATDPILIIAGIAITLILLVGGSFAISGFIANANNLNAKGDLDRIATAQAAFLAENDRYAGLGTKAADGTSYTNASGLFALKNSSLGFTPTAGNQFRLFASDSGWVAITKSASGTKYVRTSLSTAVTESVPGTLPAGIVAADVTSAFNGI